MNSPAGTIASHPQARKHSTKRQKVKLYIWVDPPEKIELERIAESEGLSVSQTGRAMIVDGIRQKLRIEREVLATPILEASFDTKMNQMMNRLAEYVSRSVFETGQLRWLYINTLYREVLHPDAKLSKEEFYKLLETSEKETIKRVKQWNPNIKDMVAAIRQSFKEGDDT
jgi:hypothetical protein